MTPGSAPAPTPARRGPLGQVRHLVGSAGLNRSMVLRRLIRLGHPRLRALRTAAIAPDTARARALAPVVRWLESGNLSVPQGHANGLRFAMEYVTIAHAHLGAIAFGTLEGAVQEAMIRHVPPGGVVFDIGANLGFFAMLGARLTGPDGRVVAFEPAPDNAEAIRVNAALNGLDGTVEVIAAAVADRSGTAALRIVEDQSWSMLAELGDHPLTDRVIDVELVTVDELVAAGRVRPPDLVKIDVEGAEVAVLEGMRQTVAAHRPAIICELHGTAAPFIAEMSRHGYRLINLEGTEPVERAGMSAHCLALPPLHPGD